MTALEFSEALKGFMKRHGMSIAGASRYFRVDRGTIVHWRAADRKPSDATVRLLSILLTLEVIAPDLVEVI